jgi:hypothetical protein
MHKMSEGVLSSDSLKNGGGGVVVGGCGANVPVIVAFFSSS